MSAVHRAQALALSAAALAALLSLSAVGCAGEELDPDDPVAQARARGRTHAIDNDYKLASDCGSLEDLDERHGCAAYVNDL